LSQTNIEVDRMLSWRFTPDLKYLVVMENTSTITCINIEIYVQNFPLYVTRKKTYGNQFSNNEVLNTVHVGDIAWRKKLVAIHDQNSVSHTQPWYIEQNINLSKIRVKERKWRMSGFWKKSKSNLTTSNDHNLEGDKKIYLPATLQGMKIVDVIVGSFSLSLHLQSLKENVLCVCDIQKQTYNIQR